MSITTGDGKSEHPIAVVEDTDPRRRLGNDEATMANETNDGRQKDLTGNVARGV